MSIDCNITLLKTTLQDAKIGAISDGLMSVITEMGSFQGGSDRS